MIALRTNDELIIYKMELRDFIQAMARDSILSPEIQKNEYLICKSNDAIEKFLSEEDAAAIECCMTSIGYYGLFSQMKAPKVSDLKFFIAEDGKQYASEDAYLYLKENQEMEGLSPMLVPPNVSELGRSRAAQPPEPTPSSTELQGEVAKTRGRREAPAALDEAAVLEGMAAARRGRRVAPIAAGSAPTETPEPEIVVEIPANQMMLAKKLDEAISSRKSPKISRVGKKLFQAIEKFVNNNREEFRERCKAYWRNHSLLKSSTLDFEIESALGGTSDLLDSMLVFPARATILSKRDLLKKARGGFKKKLKGAKLSVACPLAEVDGKRQGYYFEATINESHIQKAEELLREQGIDISKMDEEEKYENYRKALIQVFHRIENGFFHEVVDLDAAAEELEDEFGEVPDFDRWPITKPSMVFDARVKPLASQLEEVALGEKSVVRRPSVPPRVDTAPPIRPADVLGRRDLGRVGQTHEREVPASQRVIARREKNDERVVISGDSEMLPLQGTENLTEPVKKALEQAYGGRIGPDGKVWLPKAAYAQVIKQGFSIGTGAPQSSIRREAAAAEEELVARPIAPPAAPAAKPAPMADWQKLQALFRMEEEEQDENGIGGRKK